MKELSYRTAVAELGQSPYYQSIVNKVESLVPMVPAYNFKGASNIEEIKFKLAQRELHELVMRVLKGE